MSALKEEDKSSNPLYALTFDNFRDYFSVKSPLSVLVGGTFGITRAAYLAESIPLYGYTYAFGFGFGSTSYFSGTFLLRYVRNTDDCINHAISGLVNGGLMVMIRKSIDVNCILRLNTHTHRVLRWEERREVS